jgi:hypothetical protein
MAGGLQPFVIGKHYFDTAFLQPIVRDGPKQTYPAELRELLFNLKGANIH